MSTEKTQEIVTRTLAGFLTELDDVIGTSLDDLTQLEARVSAVESLHKRVGKQLSEYSVRLNRGRNALLPIYRLPIELLIDIFLRVIDLIDWDMEQNRNLASVCKAWYDIIVQSPEFWHRINVSHDIDTIKRIMRRNEGGPFSIQFDKDSIGEAKHEEVLSLLAPHSHRWQSIMFQGRLTDPIFSLISSPAPGLTELFIYQWSGESQRKFELPEGKRIRRVDVGLVSLPWSSPRLASLRSIQIRNLTKDLPSLADLSTILSSSPELTWLRLSEWTETESLHEDDPPKYFIRLPKLETLVLQSIQPRYVNHLLTYIRSDACTCLQVDEAPSRHLQALGGPFAQLLASSVGTARSLHFDLDEAKLKLTVSTSPDSQVLDKWIYWANRKPGADVTIQLRSLTDMRVVAEALGGMELLKGKGPEEERAMSLAIAGKGSDPPAETHGDGTANTEATEPFPCDALVYLPLLREIRCSNHFNATPLLRYLGRPQNNFDGTTTWNCPKLTKLEINSWESSADPMFDELKAFGEARVTASRAGEPSVPDIAEAGASESSQDPPSSDNAAEVPGASSGGGDPSSSDSSSGSGSSSDGTPTTDSIAEAEGSTTEPVDDGERGVPETTSDQHQETKKAEPEIRQENETQAQDEEELKNRPEKLVKLGVPSEVVERLKELELLKDLVSEI